MIGAGAAGISLALALADSSLDVVLVEGGGLTAGKASRSVYRVVPGPQMALGTDPSKSWHFGGNTNRLDPFGNCRPLDAFDFEPREWVRYSGWPFRRRELRSYDEDAQRMSGLSDVRWYDADQCRPHLVHAPLDLDPMVLTTRMMQVCPVLSFALSSTGSVSMRRPMCGSCCTLRRCGCRPTQEESGSVPCEGPRARTGIG